MSIFGGAKYIAITSDITLSVGTARVLVISADAGRTVTLPVATTLGGPYFYIFNGGSNGFTLADAGVTFTDSVAVNTLVTVNLAADGTWLRTQRTGGNLHADVRPTAFGHVVGGWANNLFPTQLNRAYNYLTNSWLELQNSLLPGAPQQACASIGADIYGAAPPLYMLPNVNLQKAQKYTRLTNSWAETTEKTTPYLANQAESADSKFYIFGETVAGLSAGTVTPSEYDPATELWDETFNTPEHMHLIGASSSYSNIIYLYGGVDKDSAGALSSITKKINDFTPATNTWGTSLTDSTNDGMIFMGAAQHSGVIYFAGGCPLNATNTADLDSPVTTHHSYTISTDNWANETALTTAQWGKGAFAGLGDNLLYWVGGAADGTWTTFTDDMQSYNPSGNTWSTAPTNYPVAPYTQTVTGVGNICNSSVSASSAL